MSGRMVDVFECDIPIEDIPTSLICTTYTGHLFEIDVNRYNGRVYVKYPKNEDSLMMVSRIFQILELSGFLDAIVISPRRLLDAEIVVAANPIEADELKREVENG